VYYAACSVILGLQSSVLGVDLWRFLAGIGMGTQIVAIDSFIAEITPKAIRGRAFAIRTAVQFCAVSVG
jgi:putative MFS transporter